MSAAVIHPVLRYHGGKWMLALNGAQHAEGREMHLCPMQFDLADRVIEQMSMKDEVVYDPFAGIGTVPYRAVLKGRIGRGCELARGYWLDAVHYCHSAECEIDMPTLFDLEESAAPEQPRLAAGSTV